MKDLPRRKYEAALADFAQPGNRWSAKGRLTYWGRAAGLTAEEIIADARAAGVTDRDADIRRGWNDARPKGDRPQGGWRLHAPRAKPKPPQTYPRYVRDMVAAGGGSATSADLIALSPSAVPEDTGAQTASFLRSLFDPSDVLHVFRDDEPTAGRPGLNLMPCRDWLARLERGDTMPGDLVVPNPFTGAEGETADGRKSRIAQSCLARFPFAVVEFDAMQLGTQAAFWRGLLATSPLAPKVAAVTYSGGKSLHGLLHVGCRTPAEWQTVCGRLRGLLAADPDPSFRADGQAMRPRTGTRLPGVRRFSNGRTQRLLYLNADAVRPTEKKPYAPTVHADARERPYKRTDARTANLAPEAGGRATGRFSPLARDSAPPRGLPPTIPQGDAPLDDVLAAMDVAEAWEAAGGGRVGTPEGVHGRCAHRANFRRWSDSPNPTGKQFERLI